MTIATQTARHLVTADGATTRFYFPFQFQSPALLYVGVGEDIVSTGFTITVYPDQQATPGGHVDFVTPPAQGVRVTLFRWTSFTQAMAYSAYDPFPAKSHERALDTLAMQVQQIEDQVLRSYKVPWWTADEEIPPPGGSAGADLTFPPPAPGYTLVWNTAGTGFDNAPGENSFLQWVLDAEAAAAAAAQSEINAANSATLASKWADLYPAEVVPGRWSAKYWATQANTYANAASTSASGASASAANANTYANNAKTSETNAAASALAAKASETAAKSSETAAAGYEGQAATAANAAEVSATESAASATQSAISASDSAAEALASAASAVESADSALLASKWADSLVEVVPTRYSAMYWADVAAGLVGGAVHEITSSDIEMLTVSVPQQGYRLLTLHSNVANGMVKLTSAGVIPPELMPAGGVNLIGPFRGDDLCPKYGDATGDCVEPDYRNPSERWPTQVFHTGNSFIIIMEATQASGHINAIDPATELPGVVEVFAGDGLIYFETDVLDPNDGVTVIIKAGWHVQPGWVKGGAVLAVNTLYDNTYSDWVGENVQSVLDEISGRAVLTDRVQTFTEDQYFDASIHLNVAEAIWAFDGVRDERILYSIGPGNMGFGVATLNLISFITADGGLLHHKTVTGDYQIWDAQNLVDPARLSANQRWTGSNIFNMNVQVAHGGAFIGEDNLGVMRSLAIIYPGTNVAVFGDHNLAAMAFYTSTAPVWNDGLAENHFAFTERVNHFAAEQYFYAGAGFSNNTWISFADTNGAVKNVLSLQATGGFYVGNTQHHSYLLSYDTPDWWDGSTIRPLATHEWANATFGSLTGANYWSGVQTFAAAYTSLNCEVYLQNAKHYFALDSGGNAKNIGYVGSNNILYLGDMTSAMYLMSSANPRWYDGVNDNILATQAWVMAQGQFDVNAPHTWAGTQTFTVPQNFNSYIVSQESGIDGSPITFMTIQTVAYGTTYRHLLMSAVSSVPGNSWLDFMICNGAGTWHNTLRIRGDGTSVFQGDVHAVNFMATSTFFSAGVSVLSYQGNATYVGNTSATALYLQSVNTPGWYNGAAVKTLATQEWVNSNYIPTAGALHMPAAGGYINTMGSINGAFGGLRITAHTAGYWTLFWDAVPGRIGPVCFGTVSEDSTNRIISITIQSTNSATVSIRDAGSGARVDCGFNFVVIFTTAG